MRSSSAAATADDFVLEAHVPGRYVAATSQGMLAFYWIGDADLAAMQFLDKMCEQQSAGRTRPVSAVHVVHERVGLPNAEVRSALMATLQRFGEVTCCVGIVLLGSGFWASAMQSALTGIRMLAQHGGPRLHFGASPDEIAPQVVATHASRGGEHFSEARLLFVLQQLRSTGNGQS